MGGSVCVRQLALTPTASNYRTGWVAQIPATTTFPRHRHCEERGSATRQSIFSLARSQLARCKLAMERFTAFAMTIRGSGGVSAELGGLLRCARNDIECLSTFPRLRLALRYPRGATETTTAAASIVLLPSTPPSLRGARQRDAAIHLFACGESAGPALARLGCFAELAMTPKVSGRVQSSSPRIASRSSR